MSAIIENRKQIGVEGFSGIPLLLDDEGNILDAPSDFLRWRIVEKGKSSLTVQEDAIKLRLWLRFLAYEGIPWNQATDYQLLQWRDSLYKDVYKPWLRQTEHGGHGLPRVRADWTHKLHPAGWKKATINIYLSLVFAFYLWAEENGIISGWVDLKLSDPAIRHPITSKKTKSGRLETTLLWATTKQAYRHTPTEDEIQRLHERAGTVKHGNRNTLIMSWFEETGLRRAGALRGLTVDKIPTNEQIDICWQKGETFNVLVVEKGKKERNVTVTAPLMQMTRDYMEDARYGRQAIVDRYESKPGWIQPKEIFLSDRGTELHLKSFSNIMTTVFRDAKVLNASGHRLRARFLVRLIESLLDLKDSEGKTYDYDTILLRAAEAAGHARPESLRPYLEFALKKHFVMREADRQYKNAQEARESLRHAEQWARRVARSEVATEILRAVCTGKKHDFMNAVHQIQQEAIWV